MNFKMVHNNFNVKNIDESVDFYQKALGLKVMKKKEGPNFLIVYLGDGQSSHLLELTQLYDRAEGYDLGDNEIHLAFLTDDFQAAHEKHREMGCICYENTDMGIYFIEDLDGYWLEILPTR
ncbi:MAG: VOC family protein [Oscillospiraceae bacterium]